ncbi:MAG: glycosyltransferase family 2 protein [Clostridia bacterium]|nr:glycosyltransferase family 2 protein [Clostridia bacterium]
MLVTVIIPVYKTEEYLADCANSVLNQTYSNIELILVDDGSPDRSPQICDEIAAKDSRVKVIHKPNGGAHTARNRGVEEARGDYVMFLDSDDWLDEQTIEILVKKVTEEQLDIVRFNYVREFNNGSRIKANTFLKSTTYDADACKEVYRQSLGLIGEELSHPESQNFLASACFNIYKRDLIVDNHIQFEPIKELGSFVDGLFNVQCYYHMKSFAYLDCGLYHYRKTNAGSATSNYRENFLRKRNLLLSKLQKIAETFMVEHIEEAMNSRIAIGTMELFLNVMRHKCGFFGKYKEFKEILSDDVHKKALKAFDISHLPLKWKVYYSLIKMRFALGVYFMTSVIRKLMTRGK